MHVSRRRTLLAASTIVGTAAALVLGGTASAGAASDPVLDTGGSTRTITLNADIGFPHNQKVGTFSGQVHQTNEFPPEEEDGAEPDAGRNAVSPAGVPVVAPTAVSGRPGLTTSFHALDGFDQRFANNGNQFSVEPPDQGLCAGNGYVFEALNDVLRVYKTNGAAASAVTDLNSFYGYPAAIDRTRGIFGPSITDPTCLFDAGSQRWFVNVLTLDVDSKTGALTGTDHLDIAVSKSADPLGGFGIYRLPVQDDGTQGTPKHKDCPCIGDYPHIATDANGFFVTTNEYPFSSDPGIFGNNYNGAQIYALDKAAMAAGQHAVRVVQFSRTALHQGSQVVPGFTLAPAQVPDSRYQTANNGTEYFLESIAGAEAQPGGFTGQAASIGVFQLTNTKSIRNSRPAMQLTGALKASEPYVIPGRSSQKIGPTPLASLCSVSDCLGLGGPMPSSEGPLDSNDSRMMQTYLSNGMLYTALDTGVQVSGRFQAGIAWFVVNPGSSPSNSSVAHQGYVGVPGQNVIYPAVAATPSGNGVMAFTLVGRSYYPSAAYMLFGPNGPTGTVHVAAAGAGPQDGFTEYDPINGPGSAPRPRWGDYGAAVPVGSTIWIASEYIGQKCSFATYQKDPTCGNTRAPLINWGTRISAVRP